MSYGGTLNVDEEKVMFKRLSIATEGICGIEKGLGGVWANNQMKKVNQLWPVCFDSWDCHSDQEYLEMIYQFDVWQIDTYAISNIWYLDPNIIDHVNLVGSGDASDYLYCENTIHPRALKLFTFLVNDYKFLYEDEVCSFDGFMAVYNIGKDEEEDGKNKDKKKIYVNMDTDLNLDTDTDTDILFLKKAYSDSNINYNFNYTDSFLDNSFIEKNEVENENKYKKLFTF